MVNDSTPRQVPEFSRRQMVVGAGAAAMLAGCHDGVRNPAPTPGPTVGPTPSPTATPTPTPTPTAANLVYVESNDLTPGQNSVLAYRRSASTGALQSLGGSPFPTSGKGHSNPTAGRLGPNDLDTSIILSADRRRLFAVNSGSNTIAVFDVAETGALTPVSGSPFASGGRNPVSLTIAGTRLYVAHKNEDFDQLPNGDTPNYTGFTIGAGGGLTPIPNSTFALQAMASPSQVLASRDGTLLFACDFAPAAADLAGIRSFRINTDGTLTQAPGSPARVPAGATPPLPLGIWQHPTERILYVGFVTRNQVGVYTFDASGTLTFLRAVANSGLEICWIRTTANGRRLYTVNNIDNSISYYDNSDPRTPVERQKLTLSKPGPLFLNDRGAMSFNQITSTPFEFSLSPNDDFIYVVNQRANRFDQTLMGNRLHIVTIAADGTLSETQEPIDLPVPPNSRPQGVIVL